MQQPGPDTRVVELRVHGILGTTGDELTDSVASVDVAGDGVGRIVRPADRLLRPVAGPALRVGDRSVPRIVEGYVWGGMTSGGLAKAAWALLFPFALANVAHWMLPPHRADHPVSRVLASSLRALLRLSSLLLTMLLVAQLAVATLDLVAAQCLAPGTGCMPAVPDQLRVPVLRSLVGLLPVALLAFLMHWLASVSWEVSTEEPGRSPHPAQAPVLPGQNVVPDPDTPLLRTLHITAAMSTVSLLALGGPLAFSWDPRWLVAAALLVLSLVGTLLLDDPTGRAGVRRIWSALPARVLTRSLLAVSGAVLALVALVPGQLRGPLPGSSSTIDVITAALAGSCAAVAVLLVPAALLARRSWASLPRQLRPWAGGWMSAPVLMLAALLGAGFGSGLGLALRRSLDHPELVLPAAYSDVAAFWGCTALVMLLGVLGGSCWLLVQRWRESRRGQPVPAEVALLHAGRKEDQETAAKAWRRADFQRRYLHCVLLLLVAALAVSAVPTVLARMLGARPWVWWDWLLGLGVACLAALASSLLRMVFLAAHRRNAARYLGILADLTLFWPREAHPIVPPCYALKVIPELAARAAEHLEDPDTRVVLAGHSQGSLLAVVAAARLLESLEPADRERVGLLTAGSPLQWAYARGFPGAVPPASLRELSGALNGRWRSLCRGTDPIGGAVTTWNRQVYSGMLLGVGFRADGTEGPLPAAARGPTGALVLGGEHWLPDPLRGPVSARRWMPGVLGHGEYSGDPEWDRAVAMAAGLTSPSSTAVPEQPEPEPEQPEPEPEEPEGGSGAPATATAERTRPRVTELMAREAAKPAAVRRAPAAPEATDPRGRVAPWERAAQLWPAKH